MSFTGPEVHKKGAALLKDCPTVRQPVFVAVKGSAGEQAAHASQGEVITDPSSLYFVAMNNFKVCHKVPLLHYTTHGVA